MTQKHKHHIIPKYEGGSDDSSNLVELTPTQHAMWHYAEWLRKGNEDDKLAWKGLTGLIEPSVIRNELVHLGSKRAREVRAKNNPNWHEKIRTAAIARQRWLRENNAEWKENEQARLSKLAKKFSHLGGKAGKGKRWWFNEKTGEVTKASISPGPEWRIGKAPLSDSTKHKHRQAQIGSIFWNNGKISMRSKDCPGEGWIRGRLPHKKKRLNNTGKT